MANHKPINACFNLTNDCNCKCRYCFVAQKPNYMTTDIAKDAVDYLARNLQERKENHCNITFFGGEPTLCWDSIIVPTILYIDKNYPNKFTFSMTTNGTLLNPERIQFMSDHKICPHLSIDGARETQDYNRPMKSGASSFDVVEKNIPYILRQFPSTTFRATITPESGARVFDDFIYSMKMGFSNCFFVPNNREKWTTEDKNILYNQLEKIYNFYTLAFLDGAEIPISFAALADGIKENVQFFQSNFFKRDESHCGMGEHSVSIAYNGDIFACQEQPSLGRLSIFYIGDIYNGIDEKRHNKLLKQFIHNKNNQCENKKLCINCPRTEICKNKCCPSTSYDLFQNFDIHAEMDCLWKLWNFYLSRELIEKMKEAKGDSFRNYFYKVIKGVI